MEEGQGGKRYRREKGVYLSRDNKNSRECEAEYTIRKLHSLVSVSVPPCALGGVCLVTVIRGTAVRVQHN